MQKPSTKPVYGIGIDTGGTFTDAVLVDLRSQAVLDVAIARPFTTISARESSMRLTISFPVRKPGASKQSPFQRPWQRTPLPWVAVARVRLIVDQAPLRSA
ncbi:hypothetical protein [uncultured Desulfosarcina sp.]|uniref:hypothetical protein n=1 Tax=uncultured Desulfosarcina sp. TaxID=218289 RepID=UPI0029C6D7FB|nr:hypothetical protein [uncultured Desulfosarcina sp.]